MTPRFLVGNEGIMALHIHTCPYLIPTFPTKNQPDEGVWAQGLRVWGLGIRVWRLGKFRVQRVYGVRGCRIQGGLYWV